MQEARTSSEPGPRVRLEELMTAGLTAERSGAWDEALEAYEAAFAELPRGGDAAAASVLLRQIAKVHNERGSSELAAELFEAAVAVAECAALPAERARALNGLAVAEQYRGRIAEAELLYRKALGAADQADEVRLAAMIEQNLGTLADIRGDAAGALRRYGAALQRHRLLGDDLAAAWTLNNMGMAHADGGAWGPAERCLDEAFELADRLRDQGTIGNIELNRASLYLRRKEFGRSRDCCDRAFEIFGRAGSRSGLAEAHKLYGSLFSASGKPNLADAHLERAIELARGCGDRLLEAESEAERALVHLAEGRNREALQCLNRAHGLFGELQARRELLDLDRRLDGLEAQYLQVVAAWGESIEAKDRYTAGHCQRVADYACRLAACVGFEGRELTWLRMGAFLHDVGKTVVPAEVLNKPGRLTDDEWQLMQSHTVEGHRIVVDLNFPWDIGPMVRNHHERWDGSGYPDGLAGEAIPLAARILCIADVFDALTTTRSYRPALSQDEALRIMERDAGAGLDPHLFNLFRELADGASTLPLPASDALRQAAGA